MEAEIWRFLASHWPTLALAATLLFGIYLCVRSLALTFESIGNALGPLGKFWRARRAVSQAELEDRDQRIAYLDKQVRALRFRDACYFDYMVYDEDFHRRQELLAAKNGWALEKHVSFLEYRDKWIRERGIEKEEFDIWLL